MNLTREGSKQGLVIRLLGQVTVSLDGRPVTGLPSRTAEALLVYLIMTGQSHGRDVLAELLWDERDPQQAMANLRSILSGLRRKLGPYLTITRQSVSFNLESDFWLDAAVFEAEIITLLDAIQANQTLPAEDLARLEQALALYQGDLLAGFYVRESRGFEEWVTLQRERLRRLAIVSLTHLVDHRLRQGSYIQGINDATQLLTLDPLSENAHRKMMLLQARQGQFNAALTQYRQCQETLALELGAAPAAQTTALYEQIRSAAHARRHNLPAAFTRFIGREQEMTDLISLLADPDRRLLTVLGLGGTGKTRFMIESARQITKTRPGMFLHGISYVPLAGISSADLMAGAIAEGLGISLQGSSDPAVQLLNYLREKEILLLLDNFEQLLQDGPQATQLLTDILHQAPAVHIMVTSRLPLQLYEEWLFDLAGLTVPPESAKDPQAANTYGALELFLTCASRFRRNFTPTKSDWQAIGRISRLLNGLPLGLEMAATWIRHHDCRQIADQIDHDLDFLSSKLRNVPERHRSLRAVFEHSWDLLNPHEQNVLKKLAVFPSTFSRSAADEICQVEGEVLDNLVSISLLHRQENTVAGDVPGRYTLHELIRQYAAEKLNQSPELTNTLKDRHGHYYLTYISGHRQRLEIGQRQPILEKIAAEMDNIRPAWQWAIDQGNWSLVAAAHEALYNFFWYRHHLAEGAAAMAAAAEAVAGGKPADTTLYGSLVAQQAVFAVWLSRLDEAEGLLDRAITLLRQAQAWRKLAWALETMGTLLYYRGEYGLSGKYLDEALDLFRELADPAGTASALNSLSNLICDAEADYETSVPLLEESLALYQQMGDKTGQAKCLINQGANAHIIGNHNQAKEYYQAGIKLCREIDNRLALAIALGNLGQILTIQGQYDAAEAHLQESLALKRDYGERRSMAITLKQLGLVAVHTGRFMESKTAMDEALRTSQEVVSPSLTQEVLVAGSTLLTAVGQPQTAIALLVTVLDHTGEDPELGQEAQDKLSNLEKMSPSAVVDAGRRHGEGLSLDQAAGIFLNSQISDIVGD